MYMMRSTKFRSEGDKAVGGKQVAERGEGEGGGELERKQGG